MPAKVTPCKAEKKYKIDTRAKVMPGKCDVCAKLT